MMIFDLCPFLKSVFKFSEFHILFRTNLYYFLKIKITQLSVFQYRVSNLSAKALNVDGTRHNVHDQHIDQVGFRKTSPYFDPGKNHFFTKSMSFYNGSVIMSSIW